MKSTYDGEEMVAPRISRWRAKETFFICLLVLSLLFAAWQLWGIWNLLHAESQSRQEVPAASAPAR